MTTPPPLSIFSILLSLSHLSLPPSHSPSFLPPPFLSLTPLPLSHSSSPSPPLTPHPSSPPPHSSSLLPSPSHSSSLLPPSLLISPSLPITPHPPPLPSLLISPSLSLLVPPPLPLTPHPSLLPYHSSSLLPSPSLLISPSLPITPHLSLPPYHSSSLLPSLSLLSSLPPPPLPLAPLTSRPSLLLPSHSSIFPSLITTSDDEPETGPNCYCILTGFNSTELLKNFAPIKLKADALVKVVANKDGTPGVETGRQLALGNWEPLSWQFIVQVKSGGVRNSLNFCTAI